MRMGSLDIDTSRELANLEAEKRMLELRIRRAQEAALSKNTMKFQGNYQA